VGREAHGIDNAAIIGNEIRVEATFYTASARALGHLPHPACGAADALRALLIALLAPIAVLVALPLAWRLGAVYGVVVLTTLCAQFFDPARLALIGDVVAEPDRPRASGLEQVTMSLAFVIGPAVAAPLYVALGAQWAILADALSFVISFLLVLRLRAPHVAAEDVSNERNHAGREFAAGLRIIAGNRVLCTLLVAAILAMLGFGSIDALDIFFATGTLHVAAGLYGFLAGASGAGLLAGAIVGGLYAGRFGLTRVLWLSLVAVGLLELVYARLTSFGPALLVLFLGGIPNGTFNVVINPLLLQVTPRVRGPGQRGADDGDERGRAPLHRRVRRAG